MFSVKLAHGIMRAGKEKGKKDVLILNNVYIYKFVNPLNNGSAKNHMFSRDVALHGCVFGCGREWGTITSQPE